MVPFTGEIVNGKLHFCVMDGGHWNIEEDWLQILSSRLSFTFFSPWNWKHTQKQVKIQQKRHPVELFRYCYKIFFNYLNKLPKRHTQHLLGACLNRRMLFLGGFSNLNHWLSFGFAVVLKSKFQASNPQFTFTKLLWVKLVKQIR